MVIITTLPLAMASVTPPTVEAFSPTSIPPDLLTRLNAHLPHSLTVLRRLQFASRKASTPHSHILYAHSPSCPFFAAAFVDLSRGPETECWIYSTLQDAVPPNPDATSSAALPSILPPDAADACARQVLALLRRVRAVESHFAAAGGAQEGLNEGHSRGYVRVGALHETVRQALMAAGVRVRATGVVPPGQDWEFYASWLIRVPGDLKGPDGEGGDCLPDGCRWDVLRESDTGLVKSRTKIPKREYVVPRGHGLGQGGVGTGGSC